MRVLTVSCHLLNMALKAKDRMVVAVSVVDPGDRGLTVSRSRLPRPSISREFCTACHRPRDRSKVEIPSVVSTDCELPWQPPTVEPSCAGLTQKIMEDHQNATRIYFVRF